MSSTLQLLTDFCRLIFVELDIEKALTLLSRDVCWLGNTESEDVYSIEQARVYLMNNFGLLPACYEMAISAQQYVPLGRQCGTAMLRLLLSRQGNQSVVSAKGTSKSEDGVEKLCCLQFAVIDAILQPDEDYLTTKAKKKLAAEKRELVISTMPGGLMGSYLRPGLPYYFVNERMLEYLGYGDETEFAVDIGGHIINCIHPDDREQTNSVMEKQLAAGSSYAVDYRMRKKDGSYIWVHDVGRKTLAENGEDVIISVCYDITDSKKAQQQLRDIIHNVPGGVCLYRWNGIKLCPIIVSDQFTALLGEDAEPILESTQGMDYPHVHPDDLPALQQAMITGFTKTGVIEHTYRSLNFKTKEYIWIYIQGLAVPQKDGTQLAYVSYTDVTKQHLTEQQLRASERALDFATEEAGLWYWQYDPAANCAYFNPRCMRDFGIPAVMEDYPRNWLDLGYVEPKYIDRYYSAVQQIKAGTPQVCFVVQMRDGGGMVHWVEVRFSNPTEPGCQSELVVCTARIIDDEKALEAKYEIEKHKPSLGDKALLFHGIFNLTTGKISDYGYLNSSQYLNGVSTELAPSIETLLDYIIDEKAKTKFRKLHDPQFLKEQQKLGNNSFSLEYRRRLPEGGIIWVSNILQLIVEPNTKDLLLFEYCYDIHEQKMAEEMLHVTTIYDYQRLASVDFGTDRMIPFGAYSDTGEKALMSYSRACEDFARDYVVPQGQAEFLQAVEPSVVIAKVAEHGSYSFTAKIRSADGADGVVKTRYVPYDAENQIYILSRTDVTDLLREEEAKNAALNEALSLATQANHAKSDFLASMSHDIRTPMNAIVGMCGLALADESDAEQVHESLETIRSSSMLLLSLINNILDTSRIESGKMVFSNRPFYISRELKQTIETFRSLAEEKGQSLTMQMDIKHDHCVGDAARIHSALDNILSNAIKYTPKGGSISYSVSERPTTRSEIALYRFEISDTGIGISEEQQKHLFEPFYRAQNSLTAEVEGTGLGLSIAKAIIDLKGGTISVNSREGMGTSFVVELPLFLEGRDTQSREQPLPEESAEIPDLSHLRILLCEDHPINQKVAQRLLERAGAAVSLASDGLEGINLFFQKPAGYFDLVLMDIQMPQMNGYEAAKAIRESGHPQALQIPIIAMTANAFAEDVYKSTEAGMNAHLAKPIIPEQLYAAVLQYTPPQQ